MVGKSPAYPFDGDPGMTMLERITCQIIGSLAARENDDNSWERMVQEAHRAVRWAKATIFALQSEQDKQQYQTDPTPTAQEIVSS